MLLHRQQQRYEEPCSTGQANQCGGVVLLCMMYSKCMYIYIYLLICMCVFESGRRTVMELTPYVWLFVDR